MKALFLVRHNNDFDFMAPVADGWARLSPAHESRIFVTSPELAWKDDYRTAMLAGTPRLTITDLWDIAGAGAAGRRLEHRWRGVSADTKLRRKLLQIATEITAAPGFDARMTAWLDAWRPDIVAFDWYTPRPRRKRFSYFGYQAVTAWMKANGVPLVSLPHGLALYDIHVARAVETDNRAATFVESARRRRDFMAAGRPPERIAVCGAPRYDPAWVERIVAGLEAASPSSPVTPGRVTIVFFATKRVYDFDFDRLIAWLGHLAGHPQVDLVIQPHPRGQRKAVFAALARLPNVTVDAKTPATVLIGRAQMVSTLVSSVMVEAVVRGREILYPKFVNTVSTRFEEAGACVSLGRMEDTHAAIDAFLAGKRVPRENYEAFLTETVYGDGPPHTIARICAKMMEIAAR